MRTAAARTLGVFLALFAAGVLLRGFRDIAKGDDIDAAAVFSISTTLLLAIVIGWLGSMALRNPAVLSPAVVVLFAVLAAATAAYEPHIFAPERPLALSPRLAAALRYLMHAEELQWPHIGIAGADSEGYLAMRELWRSPNADAAFKELVLRGSTAGQLYGLIGVRRTDPLFYNCNSWRCSTRRGHVEVFGGCVINHESIASIVSAPDGVRLPRGMTLEQWFRSKRKLEAPLVVDIEGGGYSSIYFDSIN
jgi:hypothetical protein